MILLEWNTFTGKPAKFCRTTSWPFKNRSWYRGGWRLCWTWGISGHHCPHLWHRMNTCCLLTCTVVCSICGPIISNSSSSMSSPSVVPPSPQVNAAAVTQQLAQQCHSWQPGTWGNRPKLKMIFSDFNVKYPIGRQVLVTNSETEYQHCTGTTCLSLSPSFCHLCSSLQCLDHHRWWLHLEPHRWRSSTSRYLLLCHH